MVLKDSPSEIRDPIAYFIHACDEYPVLKPDAERNLTSRLKETRHDLFRRCYLSDVFLERLHEATKREDSDADLDAPDQFSAKKFAGLVEEANQNLTLATYSRLLLYCYENPQAYRAIAPAMEAILNKPLDMRSHKPTEEEIEIAYLQETVPERALQYEGLRKKLAGHNLRLVVSVAKRYRERGLPFIDLIGHGNVGLMKAVDRFNPDEGFRFSTYATWWINQGIRRSLMDEKYTIRVPSYLHETVGLLRREANKRSTLEGRIVSPLEVAREEVPEESFEVVSAALSVLGHGSTASINGDGRLSYDSDEGDYVRDSRDQEDCVEAASESESLQKYLAKLSQRDGEVLKMRYFNGMTLQEIGDKINLSRERVRQIEAEALKKLNRLMSPHADAA